jgi:hypothetical protein
MRLQLKNPGKIERKYDTLTIPYYFNRDCSIADCRVKKTILLTCTNAETKRAGGTTIYLKAGLPSNDEYGTWDRRWLQGVHPPISILLIES